MSSLDELKSKVSAIRAAGEQRAAEAREEAERAKVAAEAAADADRKAYLAEVSGMLLDIAAEERRCQGLKDRESGEIRAQLVETRAAIFAAASADERFKPRLTEEFLVNYAKNFDVMAAAEHAHTNAQALKIVLRAIEGGLEIEEIDQEAFNAELARIRETSAARRARREGEKFDTATADRRLPQVLYVKENRETTRYFLAGEPAPYRLLRILNENLKEMREAFKKRDVEFKTAVGALQAQATVEISDLLHRRARGKAVAKGYFAPKRGVTGQEYAMLFAYVEGSPYLVCEKVVAFGAEGVENAFVGDELNCQGESWYLDRGEGKNDNDLEYRINALPWALKLFLKWVLGESGEDLDWEVIMSRDPGRVNGVQIANPATADLSAIPDLPRGKNRKQVERERSGRPAGHKERGGGKNLTRQYA